MVEIKLFCDTGQVETTLPKTDGQDLRDNIRTKIEKLCPGCKHWTPQRVQELEEESGSVIHLQQLIVDRARFKGGEYKLVLAMCSPVTKS